MNYLKKAKAWLAKLRYIVSNYDRDIRVLHAQLHQAEKIIRERTDIAVDVPVSQRSPCQVFIVGQYNGADYLQTYSFQPRDMAEVLDHMRVLSKFGIIRRVDAPIFMRQVFQKEGFGGSNAR